MLFHVCPSFTVFSPSSAFFLTHSSFALSMDSFTILWYLQNSLQLTTDWIEWFNCVPCSCLLSSGWRASLLSRIYLGLVFFTWPTFSSPAFKVQPFHVTQLYSAELPASCGVSINFCIKFSLHVVIPDCWAVQQISCTRYNWANHTIESSLFCTRWV